MDKITNYLNNIIIKLLDEGDFDETQMVDWLECEIGVDQETLRTLPVLKERGLI